jgi:hypothetical protein
MKNSVIITVIIAIVVGGLAFFGGMKYAQSQRRSSFAGQFGGGAGGRTGGAGGNGVRGVTGDIIASDANSITVKMTDGSSRIVLLSSTTSINKAAQATVDDLKTGEKVAVFGQTNTDGSVTAQSVQINPIMRIGGGNPGQNQGQNPGQNPTQGQNPTPAQ